MSIFKDAEATIGYLEQPGFAWDAQHDLLERARQKGCPVILDGYFGDQILFARGYLLDLAWRGRWTRVRRDLSAFGSDGDPRFFRREFFNSLARAAIPRRLFQSAKKRASRQRSKRYPSCYSRELLQRLLVRQLSRFEPTGGSGSYHARDTYRRATGANYLGQVHRQRALGLMHGLKVWYPFRDRDLVAFLMAIPGDIVNCNGVPKGILRQALAGMLPDVICNRRSKADFTILSNQAVLSEYDKVVQLLGRDCTAARFGFIDGDELERSVIALKADIANASDATAGWQISRLVSLELWLRRFFADPSGVRCTAS